jgi:hypothetical protein
MSFRSIQQNSLENSDTLSVSVQQAGRNKLPVGVNNWIRNPTWPALPSIVASDEKVIGLYAVYPDSPFIAVLAAVTSGATYTVDWGDGTSPQTYTSNTQANYTYDYTASGLDNTNGPVTFTDSGDTVNRNNHGYNNGMNISFASITTTTGITVDQIYYVVNATTNTFQLANQPGGSPITLTNDGSGTILPYKIATVIITCTSGAAFFQSSMLLNSRNSSTSIAYVNGWLDLALSGRFTSLAIGGTSPTITGLLEQIRILKHRITTYNGLFSNCYKLQNVIEITADSGIAVTNSGSMFGGCRLLTSVPLFDTANVTSTNGMFSGCSGLISVPLFNTGNVNDFQSMFSTCASLTSIPLLNTANAGTMSGMFVSCFSLPTVPLLNTTKVINMTGMFTDCFALLSVPLFDTSNVTIMTNAFSNCRSLSNIPAFNVSNVNTMRNMFTDCAALTSVSLNIPSVTDLGLAFQSCRSLTSVSLSNTGNVANMQQTFQSCSGLTNIELSDTSNVTVMNSTFNNCSGLTTIPLINMSNVVDSRSMFSGCLSLTTIPLINISNVANANSMFNGCTNLQQIPAFDLSKINQSANIGSFVSGCPSLSKISVANVYYTWSVASCKLSGARLDEIYTNLPTVFAASTAVTFQDTGDTVTLNNHGFANLRTVSFATITTTTGISINTNYFVRNVTTNTFQLSTTTTGAIINLVNNGSGTLNGQTITVTGNWGTATDTPSIATGKGWAVTGS